MPYSASGFATTRTTIQSRLVGSTDGNTPELKIDTGRAFLGWRERDTSEQDLYDELVASGPAAYVGLPLGDIRTLGKSGPFRIPIMILIARSKAADWNGTNVCDLLASVLSRLTDQSGYSTGAFSPDSIAVTGYEYDYQNNPGVLAVAIDFNFLDPLAPKANAPRGGLPR